MGFLRFIRGPAKLLQLPFNNQDKHRYHFFKITELFSSNVLKGFKSNDVLVSNSKLHLPTF